MATNPSKPSMDGGAFVTVLTEYADWSYTGDEPMNPPAEATTDTTTAAPKARSAKSKAAADPALADSAWARWILKMLDKELARQASNPRASQSRKARLMEARAHVKRWK